VSYDKTAKDLPYKISTLVYVKNTEGKILLIQRRKSPNYGLWSPIGGKLEMSTGESPFEAARREVEEEIGLQLKDRDLHLFGLISEKGYEDSCHWLMFLFVVHTRITELPPEIDEGPFGFFSRGEIDELPVPQTDKESLWAIYDEHHQGFISLRADCSSEGPLDVVVEQTLTANGA
jgi:8-oxo-dGTP diphosphatase|tara:strand:- start:556 stop:1083 length:528 start_codon:yes stop_codon:yes gene_type:complete